VGESYPVSAWLPCFRSFLLSVLGISSVTGQARRMPPTKIDFYNAALDALQAGRVEQALQAAEDALVEDARDTESWQLYILILNAMGRTDDAKNATEKLHQLGISDVDSFCLKAAEAMTAGDPATAAAHYEAAIALAPDRFDLLGSRALALLAVGEHDAAIAAASRAADLAPDDAQAHYILGRVLRLSERKTDALAALTKAVELDPNLMMALYEQGMLLAEADHLEAAIANFEKFLSVHPGDPSATQALNALRSRMTQTR